MISKALLIHEVTVKEITGRTADRKPTYSEAITLQNVWFDYTRIKSDGSEGKTESDNGTLFFDCTNSSPADFTPAENMVFIYDGTEFRVTSIKKCYGLKGLDHFEIGLK